MPSFYATLWQFTIFLVWGVSRFLQDCGAVLMKQTMSMGTLTKYRFTWRCKDCSKREGKELLLGIIHLMRFLGYLVRRHLSVRRPMCSGSAQWLLHYVRASVQSFRSSPTGFEDTWARHRDISHLRTEECRALELSNSVMYYDLCP